MATIAAMVAKMLNQLAEKLKVVAIRLQSNCNNHGKHDIALTEGSLLLDII